MSTHIFGNGNLRRRLLLAAAVVAEIAATTIANAAGSSTTEVASAEITSSEPSTRRPVEVSSRAWTTKVIETSWSRRSISAHWRPSSRWWGSSASRSHGWRHSSGWSAAGCASPRTTRATAKATVFVRIEIIVIMRIVILDSAFNWHLELNQVKLYNCFHVFKFTYYENVNLKIIF